MEALSKLGIDFHYLIIQVINFGILFVALTYFLYKPILKMLDKRKQTIAESLSKAERIADQEKEMEKKYEQRLHEAQQEASKIIQEARDFAGKERAKLIAEAENESSAIRTKALQEIEHERLQMQSEIRKQVAQLTAFILTNVIKTSTEFSQSSIQKALEEFKK